MAAVKRVTTRKLQMFTWAGSYFVILPREWVRRLDLKRGTLLNIAEEEDGRLVITSQTYETLCKLLEILNRAASKKREGSPSTTDRGNVEAQANEGDNSPTETGMEGAETEGQDDVGNPTTSPCS